MEGANPMNPTADDQIVSLLVIVAIVAVMCYRWRWRGSGTAFGTASFLSDKGLRKAGMLSGDGLIVGRTFKGTLIRLRDFCHVLVCGGTGSGKGAGIMIPNLLTWFRSSILCFDVKGDLYETTAERRAAKGERILRLAPFDGGTDAFNPLSVIPSDSPMLVDSAHALAAALVVRGENERDPHFNERAIQVIRALLVLILLRFNQEDRNLNSVQEIVSDRKLLRAASRMLQQLGGIPARLGNQVADLFDNGSDDLTKEGASVLSTAMRHLSFLDSDLVAKAVATSTFDPTVMRKRGTTLFIQIGQDQLDAQSGLLRCWTTALIRVISAAGNEQDGEVLLLLDECSALGSLPALEETLVRGRSAGLRAVLVYQSLSQVTDAFKTKPSLIPDNTNAQIHMGAPSGYEAAELLSNTLGEWTQVVENYSENESSSSQPGGAFQAGAQTSYGRSMSYSETGRALRRPDELLTQSNDTVIVLQRGMLPTLAQRVKWYQEHDFNPALPKRRRSWLYWNTWGWEWRLWAAGVLALILLALINRANQWPK
jgi:type IV secretion system protein VirD4